MWNKIRENFEILLFLFMLILLVTCIDPFENMMPAGWEKTLILLLIALYGLYAGIVFRGQSRDERERLHLALAERAGFLTGTGLLVLFIILNIMGNPVDKALVYSLVGMVITKMIVLFIVKTRN